MSIFSNVSRQKVIDINLETYGFLDFINVWKASSHPSFRITDIFPSLYWALWRYSFSGILRAPIAAPSGGT